MNGTDMYREWAPPPTWRSAVACLWEQRVTADIRHRVVPDGCADVIIGFGRGAVAVGLADGPVVHELAAGSRCLGLRVRPEAVATVFGVPGDELRNLDVPLDDVVGSAAARRLVDALVDGAPDARLTGTAPARTRAALDLLTRSTVDDTASAMGLSSRQLRRLVLAEVGLGPKQFQRVVRLRRFLAAAEHGAPLAVAAAEAGYADQPHLTREVRQLSGLTPAALLAERAARSSADLLEPERSVDLEVQASSS